MTAAVGRLADAARVLSYLDTTGGFGVQVRDTLVADAVSRIAADPDFAEHDGRGLDGRQALTYMREVLDDLAGGFAQLAGSDDLGVSPAKPLVLGTG